MPPFYTKNIVAGLIGSEIKVASDLGKGSRFSFSLPVAKGQANKSAPLVTPALSGAGDDDVIAIIEDDKQAGEALQLLLESWGYRAYVATNSDALIESFSSLSITPKALISDFQLSEHRSGVQEIQKMRSCYGESLPALLITGHINAERMDEVQQSNLSLLYKPVAPAKLRTFLRSSLA